MSNGLIKRHLKAECLSTLSQRSLLCRAFNVVFPFAVRLLLLNKSMQRGDGTFNVARHAKKRPIGL